MDTIWHIIPELPALTLGYSRDVSEIYKIWILVPAILLALGWRRLHPRLALGALLILTLVAGVNYSRLSKKLLVERVDTYDLIHYYLNSKYFDELGYYDLYPAVIKVDMENGGPYFRSEGIFLDQDERGVHLEPISVALTKGEITKQRFTPERWAEFSHDFLHLQRKMKGLDEETWNQMVTDHGFNGTAVWTAIAKPIASVVPVEQVKWLGYIDIVLLGVAVGCVGWAYGSVPALWCLFFLFSSYSTRWPTLSWAFLRYDYVAALMIAMSLLRRGKILWAGVFTGYAATLRMFPAMWLYGPGAIGFSNLVQRKIYRAGLVFLMGFMLGIGVLQTIGTLSIGADNVVVHFENMEDHNKSENISSRRIGLALALVYDGKLLPKIITQGHKMIMDEQKPLRFAIAVVSMALLGWGLRKRRIDEAYAFGFLPFFLLTTASYYYYVTRITLFILHAAGLEQRRHRVGLALLLSLDLFSNWAESLYPKYRFFLIGYLAYGLFGYTLLMALWYAIGSYWDQEREPMERIGEPKRIAGGEGPRGETAGLQT